MIKDRSIQLEGAFNVRDLGGVQTAEGREVRTGRLYRADSLHLLSDGDLQLLAPHAIATVLDLRETYEIERTGKARLVDNGANYVHVPLMGSEARPLKPEEFPSSMGEGYLMMLELCVQKLAQAIELMASVDTVPLVFHCAGGKDRTGILAAMIYLLLGVEKDVIATDYAITELALEKLHERNPISMYPEAKGYPAEFFGAAAQTMIDFITLMNEKHGSAEEYLLKIGLEQESLSRLREAMLH